MRASILRHWFLQQVLSMPRAVLRFLAGGGVVYDQGRTLDPRIQYLWRTGLISDGRAPFDLTDISLDQARVEWLETVARLGVPQGLRVRAEPVGTDHALLSAPVSGWLFRPAMTLPDAPLMVFLHQGGGVLGGAELSRAFCTLLAHHAHMPVFAPDYRLAPENRFPAGLDDARLAFDWARAESQSLGGNGKVALGGILTGANLALRLSLDLKRDFQPGPSGLLLVTPLADLSADTFMSQPGGNLWPITTRDLEIMIGHYGGAALSHTDPRLSPAREGVMVGLPRTLIASAGLDPLAAQGEHLAHRLLEARVHTLYRRYDTLPLGFDLLTGVVEEAQAATADIARTFAELMSLPSTEAATRPPADI